MIAGLVLTPVWLIGFANLVRGTRGQTSLEQKQIALHQPVCLVPMGEQIDRAELPKAVLRLDWVRRLKSSLPISLVSIPATHDAGTALGRTGWTRCQSLTIPAQLAVGVRGFDIRLRQVDSQLQIFHGEESQHLAFHEVISAFGEFLRAYPKELLVVRVREESKAIRSPDSFETAVARETQPYRDLFYLASSRTEIPTVGQLRGKILVLDNFGKLPNAVDYPNAAMGVQDDYDTSDMDKKLGEIIAKFQEAQRQTDGSVWQVNYTSSSTFSVDQLANARAVNAKVLDYLKTKKGKLGLVLMNFPSTDVIDEIIDTNF